MTPERWKLTEELYHAACARPSNEHAAFLAEACGDDNELRREIESLLNETATADAFLAGPALVPASQLAGAMTPRVMTGRSLAGYEVHTLLGAGGMGEVYRARDTKLGRDVAIKFLPHAFTDDPDRLARFEREARMLGALNHPNICTIYGLEEADGVRFLILELVGGQTLAETLAAIADRKSPASGLPLREALTIAHEIAEALEAAHDKGIIHRDLKPANIKITADGAVKVLDFGLAKTITSDGSTPDLTHLPRLTEDGELKGIVLGTAAYMSPEQARGLPLDKRTDIWALGCVLYQMLTGRVPFAGDTLSDTIARILEREPDWSALPAATPDAIRRLLARCLVKDPKHRLRDVGDVRIEIDAIGNETPSAVSGITEPRARLTALTPWLPWVALIVAALGAWQGARVFVATSNPLANARIMRLTNWEGAEEGAEISPDGKFVAFLSDHAGEFDIWLTQVGTGRFSNLTRDIPPLAPAGFIVRKLGFSEDGANIWFNPAERKPLLLMPLTGGRPRAFLAQGANTPAWSPDGERLVYFAKPLDGADPMFVADRIGANAHQILAPQAEMHSNNPVWSADGEWIYFVSGSEPQDEMDVNVWRLRASGGSPEQLTTQHAAANFPAVLNARTLLYVARDEDGTGPWLWALDIPRKSVERVPAGVDQLTSVASSRDGHRIVATVANPSATLWRVPLLDRTVDERDAAPYPLPMPSGRVRAPRFAGTSMFYLSARGTSDGLWKVQDENAAEVWRDVDGALFEPPAPSPDGQRVVIVTRHAGKRHLSIMSADGTNPRTLAPSIEIQGAAGQSAVAWSPDGTSLVAGGRDAQGPALFKIPVDGGAAERLVAGKWVNPLWSPNGDLIVFAGRSIVGQVTLLGVRPDGTSVDLPQVLIRPGGYRFLPDGSGLVYLPGIHALDFWFFDLATKQSRRLTELDNRGTLRTFDITQDGRSIVFDRSRQNSDVVVIDLPSSR